MERPDHVSNYSCPEHITLSQEFLEECDQEYEKLVQTLQIPKLTGLREVYRSGYWVADQLKKLKCPDREADEFAYLQGRLSALMNPWKAAELVLEGYKFSLKEKNETSL